MISREHKSKLKTYLKGAYIVDVLDKLSEKGVVAKSGKPYSSKMISHILNGRYENLEIERAIFEVYQERLKLDKAEKLERDRILGIKPTKPKKRDSQA